MRVYHKFINFYTFQFNQEVINRAIADVLNSRSEKQSARLQGEIDDLRRTLNKLIKQS